VDKYRNRSSKGFLQNMKFWINTRNIGKKQKFQKKKYENQNDESKLKILGRN